MELGRAASPGSFGHLTASSGEIVALKVLRNRYCKEPEQAAQFIREGKLGMLLRHPNVVPIYQVVSQGTLHFLVMEFVEGWNLRDLVKIRKKLIPCRLRG